VKYDEAFNKNDPAALAALFTENAVLVTPQGTIYGRKAIEKYSADNYLRWHSNNLVHTVDRLIAVGNDVTGRHRRFVDSPTVPELRKTTPVMTLSALAILDKRVRRLRSGSDDYLTKPFAFSELLARIQDRLNYLHMNLTPCFKSSNAEPINVQVFLLIPSAVIKPCVGSSYTSHRFDKC